MKTRSRLVVVTCACVAVVVVFFIQRSDRIRREAALQEARQVAEKVRRERDATANQLADRDAELERIEKEAAEVHRLRGEIRKLKSQLEELADVRRQNNQLREALERINAQAAAEALADSEAERETDEAENMRFRQLTMAKMEFAKQLALGMFSDPSNRLPADPGEIPAVVPDEFATVVKANRFEMMYAGTLDELADPARTIIMREREAVQAPDGRWFRTYLFGDGHSESHIAAENDFEEWERERTVPR